jgi:two-component system, chemotaxis family, sensor kinase CheA
MFGDLKSGREPEPAPPALITDLAALAVPDAAGTNALEPVPESVPEPPPVAVPEPSSAPPSDESAPPSAIEAESTTESVDEISEAEFEALLDALSGQPSASPPDAVPEPPAPAESEPPKAVSASEESTGANDLITDDEFESLLDQLHGSEAAKPVEPVAQAEPSKPSPPPAPIPSSQPSRPAVGAPSSPPAPSVDPEAAKGGQRAAAAPAGETSVRVDTQRLDEIMNLVGELVLVRNRLSMLRVRTGDEEIGKAIASLALVTSDLQMAVMKTRMQPVKKVFGRFPRVVRDLARNLGKEIELETFGEETDLDKNWSRRWPIRWSI